MAAILDAIFNFEITFCLLPGSYHKTYKSILQGVEFWYKYNMFWN